MKQFLPYVVGSLSVLLLASCGGGDPDPRVDPDNEVSPVAQDAVGSLEAGATASVQVVATDDNPGDVLTYKLLTTPSHGTLTIDETTGLISYTHTGATAPEQEIIEYQVSDGTGDDTATVTINITNTAPVFGNQQMQTIAVSAGNDSKIAMAVSDPEGHDITLALGTTIPNKGSVAIAGTELTYSAGSEAGSDSFSIVAKDSYNAEIEIVFSVAINDPNQVQVDDKQAQTQVGEEQEITLPVTNLDADLITWSIETQGSLGTARFENGKLFYKANGIGTDSVVVKAEDSQGSDISQITIVIENEIPVAAALNESIGEGEQVSIALKATDADGHDIETFEIVDQPSLGEVLSLHWVSFGV